MIKDAEKESKSVEKRDNGGKVRCGYSAAPLAYTAAHDADFVGTKMASMGLSARSGHSRR